MQGRTSLQRKVYVSMVQHAQRLVQLGAVHMQDVDPPARIARPLVFRWKAPCSVCKCEQANIRLEPLATDHACKVQAALAHSSQTTVMLILVCAWRR